MLRPVQTAGAVFNMQSASDKLLCAQAIWLGGRVAKRWELNSVLIVNNNNRTTVGLANNTGQQ